MAEKSPVRPKRLGQPGGDGRAVVKTPGLAGPRAMRVTQKDIAQACGLSIIAVSYALRGDRSHVSQETIDLVMAAAGRLGYDPAMSHAARRLRSQYSGPPVMNHLAALFFPFENLGTHYWASIMQGVQLGLTQSDYGVLSYPSDREDPVPDPRPPLPTLFRRGDVDGAIIMRTANDQSGLIAALRREPGFGRRPIVTMIQQVVGCSSVLVDDQAVGQMAASHLLELGHRDIVCFHSEHSPAAPGRPTRHTGFIRAFEAHGLDAKKHLHVSSWLWNDRAGMDAATRRMLDRFPQATGILCPNDRMGLELAYALQRLGRRIPKDLSLIGVDDCEEFMDQRGRNIFTTVRIPLLEMGRQAACMLIDRIEAADGQTRSLTLPVSLVVRGSTRHLAKP